MTVTVNINSLSLCHKNSSGFVKSTIPDVCLTPVGSSKVPIPYTNVAFSKDLAKGTKTISADGAMCAVKGSEFSKSIGDEPGTGGGVASGVQLDKATWLSWSSDVFMEGKAVCRLTDKMLLNKGNTVSMGGEKQQWLDGDDPDMDELCDIACNCRNAARRQQCVADKIKEQYYNGDYPIDPGNGIQQEVSMKLVDGIWQVIMNRAGSAPTSNPFTPRGGIRPDTVVRQGGNTTKVVEIKFEGDTLSRNQIKKYPQAAQDLEADYEVLDVEEDCDCSDGDGGEGEGLTTGQKVGIGAGIIAGIAAIACIIAEPCGAILGGGALLGGTVAVAQ